MIEAILIFPNMRGGCATVDGKVHALFRVNGRRPGVATLSEAARSDPPRRMNRNSDVSAAEQEYVVGLA